MPRRARYLIGAPALNHNVHTDSVCVYGALAALYGTQIAGRRRRRLTQTFTISSSLMLVLLRELLAA